MVGGGATLSATAEAPCAELQADAAAGRVHARGWRRQGGAGQQGEGGGVQRGGARWGFERDVANGAGRVQFKAHAHHAFLLPEATPAGDLVRPILAADKALVADARIFDVYRGAGVPEGFKSVAVEVRVQPREQTLTEADIEALSDRIVAAAGKATGARLRG